MKKEERNVSRRVLSRLRIEEQLTIEDVDGFESDEKIHHVIVLVDSRRGSILNGPGRDSD